ncbi:MAG: muconolactone Delta-isomerase family protein [Actinomycetota bacterium]|nr:muconolactone Delta-isomerase family protein [Actinomycetota bacterium]MDQ2958153.1 muconolactone Delta-isomerase family protein [Actinomycetota bacterium]
MEYLVHLESTRQGPADDAAQAAAAEAEGARVAAMLAEGTLVRIWRDPGRHASWMLLRVDSPEQLHSLLASLPFFVWLNIQVHPLAAHNAQPHD